MTPAVCRTDLHVHSTASQESRLGVQRALGLRECATPPEEVYELAKRRGMDFVTITDHDTIDGALAISERPDVFISEELTASFRAEPQAVHVLCYGITPDDHDWLQAHAHDVELCAAYLHDAEIACALAHPFYAVRAPLEARHRRRLAQLFPIWETRNGSRARELNLPAHVYIETHGGTGIGGSDDHAGVDIGRTYTETPPATTPPAMLAHLRAGRASSAGEQGSAAKWAHAAMALSIRALGSTEGAGDPDPRLVLDMAARVLREGGARHGANTGELTPCDARSLLAAWLAAVGLDGARPGAEQRLLAMMQDDEFSHSDLFRRARRVHERKLAAAAAKVTAAAADPHNLDVAAAAGALFEACIPAIPYAPAVAFLGREKARLVARESERPRVALVADAIGSMHGVTHALEQIRERGVRGFEVEVIGTDPGVDRRLSAVAEVQVPYYPGLTVGVPSLPAVVEALSEGRFDLVHLCSPGPAGVAACALARALELPVLASHHTELPAYVGLRSGNPQLEILGDLALASFYGACDFLLSPSAASDERLEALGVQAERIMRWGRGVDTDRFNPARRVPGLLRRDAVNIFYAGRLTREKGVELLADAFTVARERSLRDGGPDLHLVLAGGGPDEQLLRSRLGERATFLGWLHGDELPRAYASADLFLFASVTDTFGQVLQEAQASGLPIVAVAEGGPASVIRDGETGLLRPADPQALADALLELVGDEALRARLTAGGLASARASSWETSLEGLASGYRRALTGDLARGGREDFAAAHRRLTPNGGGLPRRGAIPFQRDWTAVAATAKRPEASRRAQPKRPPGGPLTGALPDA